MDEERDREEWTDESERELSEPEAEPMPVQEAGLAVGLEGLDVQNPDVDPEIAEEVRIEEETRQAEGDPGDVETVLNFRDEADEEEES
jgi:hypothetical protein